ncbi:MAG: hypothetical protein ACK4N5_20545, partial [Myxococcales bacterium]
IDAGQTGQDAGELPDAGESDAGHVADAGTTDAGQGDAGGPRDAGIEPGVRCGAAQCPVGEVCCVTIADGGFSGTCASSCADGGQALACDGPEDCSGQTGICCGEVRSGAGTPPNCPIASAKSSCTGTCNTSFSFFCPGTNTVRLCHTTPDCTESSAPTCCTYRQGSDEISFCTPNLLKQYAVRCDE